MHFFAHMPIFYKAHLYNKDIICECRHFFTTVKHPIFYNSIPRQSFHKYNKTNFNHIIKVQAVNTSTLRITILISLKHKNIKFKTLPALPAVEALSSDIL